MFESPFTSSHLVAVPKSVKTTLDGSAGTQFNNRTPVPRTVITPPHQAAAAGRCRVTSHSRGSINTGAVDDRVATMPVFPCARANSSRLIPSPIPIMPDNKVGQRTSHLRSCGGNIGCRRTMYIKLSAAAFTAGFIGQRYCAVGGILA
jgi:hypothetical protein